MKVKVFNENVFPLKQYFKGEDIEIEPEDYWRDKKGKIKEIDQFEANEFRGAYLPVPVDGSGKMVNEPRYHKKIRIEAIDYDAPTVIDIPKCMAQGCKHVAVSQEALAIHTRDKHPGIETLILPEQEEVIQRKSKAVK